MINSNDHPGPKRIIVKTESLPKTIPDFEPYQQKITLSCGHWAYNTFGEKHPKLYEGMLIKCLKCHQDEVANEKTKASQDSKET